MPFDRSESNPIPAILAGVPPAYIYLPKGTKGAAASQANKKNSPTPNKIIIAGTAATANLTMKPTMLKNGMSTSTTVTFAGRSFLTTFAAPRWID